MLEPVAAMQGPITTAAEFALLMQTTRILVAPKAPVGGTVKLKGYTVPAAQLPQGILIKVLININ